MKVEAEKKAKDDLAKTLDRLYQQPEATKNKLLLMLIASIESAANDSA